VTTFLSSFFFFCWTCISRVFQSRDYSRAISKFNSLLKLGNDFSSRSTMPQLRWGVPTNPALHFRMKDLPEVRQIKGYSPVGARYRPARSSTEQLRVPGMRTRTLSRVAECDRGWDFRFHSYSRRRWKRGSRCPTVLSTARPTRASTFLIFTWNQDSRIV